MNPQEFAQFTQAWRIGVFLAGMFGIVVGLSIERAAQRYGWPMMRRLVPAFVIAVILAVLFSAEKRGYLPPPPKATKQVAWLPYCEDWFYYIQPACWFLP